MTTDYENSHTATLLYHHRAETAGEELSSGRFLSAPRQQRQSERLGELQHSSGEKLFDCKLGSARLGSVHTLYRSCIISVASCLFVCCSSSPPPLLRVHITSSAWPGLVRCDPAQLGVTRLSSAWPGSVRCDPVQEQQISRLRAAGSSYSPAALRASCSSRRGALPPGRTGRREPEAERSRCTGRGCCWFMAAAHGSDPRMDSWWALRGDGRARKCEEGGRGGGTKCCRCRYLGEAEAPLRTERDAPVEVLMHRSSSWSHTWTLVPAHKWSGHFHWWHLNI